MLSVCARLDVRAIFVAELIAVMFRGVVNDYSLCLLCVFRPLFLRSLPLHHLQGRHLTMHLPWSLGENLNLVKCHLITSG